MNLHHLRAIRATCFVAAGLACAAAGAANLSPAAYTMASDEVKAAYKAERDTCSKMSGNAKDICEETAAGKEKVAMAHLQYQRSGDAKDMAKVIEARYDARYEIAKEVCDDQAGNAKDVCVAQAKADHEKAKADAKLKKSTAEARTDAAAAKDKADYAVASQRCDNMSGDAKNACMASARARYGQ
jgi:uncharacterized protein with LGFP repeats